MASQTSDGCMHRHTHTQFYTHAGDFILCPIPCIALDRQWLIVHFFHAKAAAAFSAF